MYGHASCTPQLWAPPPHLRCRRSLSWASAWAAASATCPAGRQPGRQEGRQAGRQAGVVMSLCLRLAKLGGGEAWGTPRCGATSSAQHVMKHLTALLCATCRLHMPHRERRYQACQADAERRPQRAGRHASESRILALLHNCVHTSSNGCRPHLDAVADHAVDAARVVRVARVAHELAKAHGRVGRRERLPATARSSSRGRRIAVTGRRGRGLRPVGGPPLLRRGYIWRRLLVVLVVLPRGPEPRGLGVVGLVRGQARV